MKLFKIILLSGVILTGTLRTMAWDEVTHAYMTQMIPDLIKDPELKKLLKENIDEFTYGCWYTDIYQYAGEPRINALNPHRIHRHDAAFMPYLQKEEVKKQENYHQLVALYLGSIAHIGEDLWYDNNLNPYQKQKPDRFKGDSKHGAFVAKQFGYTGIQVKCYLPFEELYKIYSEAGQLVEEVNTFEKFKTYLDESSKTQYNKLTSLKFLNFVGGNQLYSVSPWTAANLKDAPGGMLNTAEVVAKLVENTWLRINKKEVPAIIHAQYMWPVGSMSFMLDNPDAMGKMDKYHVFVINQNGDTLHGTIEHKWNNSLVRRFKPHQPFEEGAEYTLFFERNSLGEESLNSSMTYPFTAHYDHDMANRLAGKKPWYKTMGLGLFGFIPFMAMAGLFLGMAGMIRFRWNVKSNTKLPVRLILVRRIFQLAAIAAIVMAVYMLANRGWNIVEMAF